MLNGLGIGGIECLMVLKMQVLQSFSDGELWERVQWYVMVL